jgi:hypothetical protein
MQRSELILGGLVVEPVVDRPRSRRARRRTLGDAELVGIDSAATNAHMLATLLDMGGTLTVCAELGCQRRSREDGESDWTLT